MKFCIKMTSVYEDDQSAFPLCKIHRVCQPIPMFCYFDNMFNQKSWERAYKDHRKKNRKLRGYPSIPEWLNNSRHMLMMEHYCAARNDEQVDSAKAIVDCHPPSLYSHLQLNLKKFKKETERLRGIEKENRMLMERIAYIMKAQDTFDMLNEYKQKWAKRERELRRMNRENLTMQEKFVNCVPWYHFRRWCDDLEMDEKLKNSITEITQPCCCSQDIVVETRIRKVTPRKRTLRSRQKKYTDMDMRVSSEKLLKNIKCKKDDMEVYSAEYRTEPSTPVKEEEEWFSKTEETEELNCQVEPEKEIISNPEEEKDTSKQIENTSKLVEKESSVISKKREVTPEDLELMEFKLKETVKSRMLRLEQELERDYQMLTEVKEMIKMKEQEERRARELSQGGKDPVEPNEKKETEVEKIISQEAKISVSRKSKDLLESTKKSEKELNDSQELEKELKSSQESEKELKSSQESEKDLKSAKESEKELKSAKESEKELKSSQESEKELKSAKESEKELKSAKESEKELKSAKESEKELKSAKESEKELKSAKESEKELKSAKESEKELKSAKESEKELKSAKESEKELSPQEQEEQLQDSQEPEQKEQDKPSEEDTVPKTPTEENVPADSPLEGNEFNVQEALEEDQYRSDDE